MKAIHQHLYALLLVSIVFVSCRKHFAEEKQFQEPGTSAAASNNNEEGFEGEGDIKIEEFRQNPYTVTNMAQALVQVRRKGLAPDNFQIIPQTHLYVKFKPRNMAQYEVLSSDSTLFLLDYPVEADVVEGGNRYHDPSLPDSIPTYQYTSVPANYRFNDSIPYELLSDLYIPEQDPFFMDNPSNKKFMDALLDQAYIQTGNFEDTVKYDVTDDYKRFRPGGRIRLFDKRLNQLIGFEGVRVEARRWFTVHTARPNYEGYYRMSHGFDRACNYSAWFATGSFSVHEKLYGLTNWINGPKKTGDWNYEILGLYDRFAGHVFRGAYRYFHKDISGLKRPDVWNGARTFYHAVNKRNEAGVNWIFLPVIQVWRYNNDGLEYFSDEIFSTTCHETAHQTHFKNMNAAIQYWQVSRQIQESWAIGVEWFLTHKEYAERGIPNYGQHDYYPDDPPGYPNAFGFQYWSIEADANAPRYTSLFIDILDDHNQFGNLYFPRGYGTVNDRVKNYHITTIERSMKHVYGLASLAKELKNNKPAGVTDQDIDLLLVSFN